jgi:hypothetical protein
VFSETIPEPLDTTEFRTIWAEWLAYRRWRPATLERQLALLAGWGAARAVAALTHTITSGFVRIEEPPTGTTPAAEAARRKATMVNLNQRFDQQDAEVSDVPLDEIRKKRKKGTAS